MLIDGEYFTRCLRGEGLVVGVVMYFAQIFFG
jgi:hypothetical protein